MLEIVTGEMPLAAKKMLWQAHGIRLRNEIGAALLRDGVCYAWAGLDPVDAEDEYFCYLVRDFGHVFYDIPRDRWSEIQDWGTFVIFDWIFNGLEAKRITTQQRENSTLVNAAVDRMRNGQWQGKTWECKAEDMVLHPAPKPDFV